MGEKLIRGYPRVGREEVKSRPSSLGAGEVVDILGEEGRFLARGYYEPDSIIAFRVLSKHQEEIDKNFFRRKIKNACDLRRPLFKDDQTDVFRLVNGEGDFIPGLNVDIYGNYLLLGSYSYGIVKFFDLIVSALSSTLPSVKGIYHKNRITRSKIYPSAPKNEGDTEHVWGEEAAEEFELRENGFRFLVSFRDGGKTGLYLDMRSNRESIERIGSGLGEVLNTFSYTASFSLYALRGGAGRVANIDLSKKANDLAKRNFILNGHDPKKHEFFTDQVHPMLERFKRRGRSFDLIILDPPTFSTASKGDFSLTKDYRKMAQLSFEILNRGGFLAAAANSRQVDRKWLIDTLYLAAASNDRRLQVVNLGSLPPDFPTLASTPEERYLKFVLLRTL